MSVAPIPPVLFTVETLADYLSVSKSFVYKLAASGRIRSYKVGKELRFSNEHVAEYLDACSKDKSGKSTGAHLKSVSSTTKRSRKTFQG